MTAQILVARLCAVDSMFREDELPPSLVLILVQKGAVACLLSSQLRWAERSSIFLHGHRFVLAIDEPVGIFGVVHLDVHSHSLLLGEQSSLDETWSLDVSLALESLMGDEAVVRSSLSCTASSPCKRRPPGDASKLSANSSATTDVSCTPSLSTRSTGGSPASLVLG